MRKFFSLLVGMGVLATPVVAQQCQSNKAKTVRVVSGHQETCPLSGKVVAVSTAAEQGDGKSVVDIAVANKDFSTLVAAVKAAGLVETLSGKGPFTVFAPTNAAFAKLPKGTVESLLKPENKDQLVSILTYHVVPGKVMASDVVKIDEAKSVQGQMIKVEVKDGSVILNGSSKVVKTDIVGSNGVIHVIDSVILPSAGSPKTIAELAIETESLSTLVAAVKAAGLVDTLKGEGPFTVFAPTNEAFAKLPAGTVESLLKPENLDKLKQILLYHVVPGKVMAADVVKVKAAKSVQGEPIAIEVVDGAVKLNQTSKVISTDIDASNGVIHVIDSVILPPNG
jgi:transforming growth factor-beta-induced protein